MTVPVTLQKSIGVCDDGYLGVPVPDGLVNLTYSRVYRTQVQVTGGGEFFLFSCFSSPSPDPQILRRLSRTRLLLK